MPSFWIIRGQEELDTRLEFLKQHLIEKGVWPIRLDIKKYVQSRTIDQNALHWMWCGEIAEFLTSKGRPATKEEIHLLMRHKFLGYEDLYAGTQKIERQLVSTTSLDTGEMFRFMEQQEEWASSLGVYLTIPKQSEYWELREKQIA